MSDFNRGTARTVPTDRADMSVDVGLRSFMLGVYNKVALGLVLSGVLAYVTGQVAPVQALLYRVTADGRLAGLQPLGYVVAFAPLVVMLIGMGAIRNATRRRANLATDEENTNSRGEIRALISLSSLLGLFFHSFYLK